MFIFNNVNKIATTIQDFIVVPQISADFQIEVNETYNLEECIATQKPGNIPQYYDESSIVSLLEKI